MTISQSASEFISALDSEYTYDLERYIERSSVIARRMPDLVNRAVKAKVKLTPEPDDHSKRTEHLRKALDRLSRSNVEHVSRMLLRKPWRKTKRVRVDGYVYFICDPVMETVKIGHSTNPEKRLRALQTASAHKLELLGFVKGSQGLEEKLQERFAEHHLRGEHFRMTSEIENYAKSLAVTVL